MASIMRRKERSNCLGCQGGLVYFLVLDLLGLPGLPMLQHGIEHRQQLMHTRRQSDFFAFPCSEKPLIKGFDLRVETCRHERAHVQYGAHMRAAAPNGAPAPQSSTIAVERRHADQGRTLLPRERPQLGEFQQESPGTHWPNAWNTLQQVIVFSPQWARPEHRLEVVVSRGNARIEPGNMGLNVLRQAPARPREAVLFRSPHADQLLAAPQEGAQLLRLGVGQWPRRWANRVGKVG